MGGGGGGGGGGGAVEGVLGEGGLGVSWGDLGGVVSTKTVLLFVLKIKTTRWLIFNCIHHILCSPLFPTQAESLVAVPTKNVFFSAFLHRRGSVCDRC